MNPVRNLILVCAAILVLPVGMAAQDAPIVDFSALTEQNGTFSDKTGNAVLTPGKGTSVTVGPFGGKALAFDGTIGGAAALDLDKIKPKLDGFELAISYWIKFDAFQDADEIRAGNDSGLGLSLTANGFAFHLNSLGPAPVNASGMMSTGRWNHVAFLYSIDKKITALYVNGYPVLNASPGTQRMPLIFAFGRIGNFKGALADLKIYERPPDPESFLAFSLDDKLYAELTAAIDQIEKSAPGAKIMTDALRKTLDAARTSKRFSLEEYDAFMKKLIMTQKLVPAVNALAGTPLKNVPFAFMQVRAISPEIRTPSVYPTDPVYTATLTGSAAKDEYESLSFIVHPYRDIGGIEFTLNALTGENGGTIPVENLELKLVKCWFQPSWNSYFNGGGNLVPSLLLNDDSLLRVDENAKRNYLRLNYPDGVKYADICVPGSVLKEDPFNFAFEPAYDADTLQPVPLKFGRGQQFWLTIHAPADVPAGVYRGKIQMKADGQDAGAFEIAFRVHPFTLPIPSTQYDLSKEYFTELTGSAQLALQIGYFKDEEKAFERLKLHIANQLAHGIRGQSPGFEAVAPGMNAFRDSMSGSALFEKDLRERLKFGLKPQYVYLGQADRGGMFRAANDAQVPFEEYATAEVVAAEKKQFRQDVDAALESIKKVLGNLDAAYFYGIDEAQSAGTMRFMSSFRDYIFQRGGHVVSTGWHENYLYMPSHEEFHCQAAEVTRPIARRWHAIRGRIACYAGPFIGPDNPDLMRRSHGMKMFRNNYDGWYELQYDGSSNYHTWNNFFGYDTTYRPFRFIVSTCQGPIINTIAFSGMREGMDDIRYATLLNQLAQECFDSGDVQKILAGRKAVAWFRSRPLPVQNDLDALRAGMTEHILTMMKILGKETK